MGAGDMLLGLTLRWTGIPTTGGVGILLGMSHGKQIGISSGRLGL